MEINLGDMVLLTDFESFILNHRELVHEDDLENLKMKVEAGEGAVVFDVDEDRNDLVDIVFMDGYEIFAIPKSYLKLIEDEDDEYFYVRKSDD